jgi:hypothetical protein
MLSTPSIPEELWKQTPPYVRAVGGDEVHHFLRSQPVGQRTAPYPGGAGSVTTSLPSSES